MDLAWLADFTLIIRYVLGPSWGQTGGIIHDFGLEVKEYFGLARELTEVFSQLMCTRRALLSMRASAKVALLVHGQLGWPIVS